ncbi:MAG: hypothetical protein AAF939_09115 [Planctomycetota bacterium]
MTADEIPSRIKLAYQTHFGVFSESDSDGRSSDAVEHELWMRVVFDVFEDVSENKQQLIFEELWDYFASPDSWRLFDDVEYALNRLSSFRWLAIGSNFDSRIKPIAKSFELIQQMPVFCSAELGFRKPASSFYDELQKSLESELPSPNFDSTALYFIGDDYENDCAGPTRSGWIGLWLNRQNESATCNSSSVIQFASLIEAADWIRKQHDKDSTPWPD